MHEARHGVLPDGRRLGYTEFGDLDGSPVFFFHGWIGSRLDFAPNDEVARAHGLRVIGIDRPGCGESDPLVPRSLLDWSKDVAAAADRLGIERFGLLAHSFGGPYAAACAHELADRVTATAIVAGIAPVTERGVTRGMLAPVRAVLWVGSRAPSLTKPYVSALAWATTNRQDEITKGLAAQLPPAEAAMFDGIRFDGFVAGASEMVKHGSDGAFQDACAFLSPEWGFDVADIRGPVGLFYGAKDKNVPLAMGEYYRSRIPHAKARLYPDGGHFVFYSEADEILSWLASHAS